MAACRLSSRIRRRCVSAPASGLLGHRPSGQFASMWLIRLKKNRLTRRRSFTSVSVRGSDVVDTRGYCPADFARFGLLRLRLRRGTADAPIAARRLAGPERARRRRAVAVAELEIGQDGPTADRAEAQRVCEGNFAAGRRIATRARFITASTGLAIA